MNSDEIKDKTLKNKSFWVMIGTAIGAFAVGDWTQGVTHLLGFLASVFGG